MKYQTETARFAVGARPMPHESLAGFICRLAARRGMRNGMFLARRAGMPIMTSHVSIATLKRLASAADIDLDELAAIYYGPKHSTEALFHGRQVHWALLRGNSAFRRVCPECLEVDGYHRAVWDLSFGSVCPLHSRDMIVRCCKCGRNFTWSRGILDRCVCGETKLLAESPRLTHPEFLDPIAIGFGLLGDERFAAFATAFQELGPLSDMSPYNALVFICRLGADFSRAEHRDFQMDFLFDRQHGPDIAIARGVQAIAEWPERIANRNQGDDEETYERNRSFRWRLFEWLVRLPPGEGLIAREAVKRDPLGRRRDFDASDVRPSFY